MSFQNSSEELAVVVIRSTYFHWCHCWRQWKACCLSHLLAAYHSMTQKYAGYPASCAATSMPTRQPGKKG